MREARHKGILRGKITHDGYYICVPKETKITFPSDGLSSKELVDMSGECVVVVPAKEAKQDGPV